MDGQIFRGPDGTAGEIGHASLDEYGALCRCGNRGCLETLVRTPVLLRLLEPTHGPDLSVARMVALAHDGDTACRRLIVDAGRQVGLAAANMCNLLNPERIVLGGELSQAADLLIEPMRDVISRHGIPSAARRVHIVPAASAPAPRCWAPSRWPCAPAPRAPTASHRMCPRHRGCSRGDGCRTGVTADRGGDHLRTRRRASTSRSGGTTTPSVAILRRARRRATSTADQRERPHRRTARSRPPGTPPACSRRARPARARPRPPARPAATPGSRRR